MKLPKKLMIALHVSTASLYVSHRMDWKESSRAPSLANSSARVLPAAMKRPVSSSLARSALDKCALQFVTESMWASSPMSRKQSQIRLHTSACGLRAAVQHFGPHSKPLSTVALSETNVAPGSDKMMACQSAHISARKIRRCTEREIGMAPLQTCLKTEGLFDPDEVCTFRGKTVYCTTELCLSLDKREKRQQTKKERCECTITMSM